MAEWLHVWSVNLVFWLKKGPRASPRPFSSQKHKLTVNFYSELLTLLMYSRMLNVVVGFYHDINIMFCVL